MRSRLHPELWTDASTRRCEDIWIGGPKSTSADDNLSPAAGSFGDQHLWLPYNRAPTMSFAAGARLGPYEIVTLIGTGGMGEVYKARDIVSTVLSRSSFFHLTSAQIRIAGGVSSVRRKPSLRWLTRTFVSCTTSGATRVVTSWSWSIWRARRFQRGCKLDGWTSITRFDMQSRFVTLSTKRTIRASFIVT